MVSFTFILYWVVIAFAVTSLAYATIKIFLTAFKYNKEQRENNKRIEKLINK